MSWHEHAACLGRSDINWFPAKDMAPALAICRVCIVRADCLADALTETYQNGVRGGYTPAERDGMVRRAVRTPPDCGTDAGYEHHRRVTRTPTCPACRQAHAVANYERSMRPQEGRQRRVCGDCGRRRSCASTGPAICDECADEQRSAG